MRHSVMVILRNIHLFTCSTSDRRTCNRTEPSNRITVYVFGSRATRPPLHRDTDMRREEQLSSRTQAGCDDPDPSVCEAAGEPNTCLHGSGSVEPSV